MKNTLNATGASAARTSPVESKTGERRGESFQISAARYAQGKAVVRVRSLKDTGFKGPGARLAEALGGRWTHRDGGYQMSPARAQLWDQMHALGWDANTLLFRNSVPEFDHPDFTVQAEHGKGIAKHTLKQAQAAVLEQLKPISEREPWQTAAKEIDRLIDPLPHLVRRHQRHHPHHHRPHHLCAPIRPRNRHPKTTTSRLTPPL